MISVKDYSLKLTQLFRYAPELVPSIRARMRKFVFGLYGDLVLECKGTMFNNDLNLSRLVVYMQQAEGEKKM